MEEQHAIKFTDVRTAAFGRERLVNVVMQVPGQWNVDRAHEYADMVEDGVDEAVGGARTIVHVEPLGTTTHVEFNWI